MKIEKESKFIHMAVNGRGLYCLRTHRCECANYENGVLAHGYDLGAFLDMCIIWSIQLLYGIHRGRVLLKFDLGPV